MKRKKGSHTRSAKLFGTPKQMAGGLETRQPMETEVLLVQTNTEVLQLISQNLCAQSALD